MWVSNEKIAERDALDQNTFTGLNNLFLGRQVLLKDHSFAGQATRYSAYIVDIKLHGYSFDFYLFVPKPKTSFLLSFASFTDHLIRILK